MFSMAKAGIKKKGLRANLGQLEHATKTAGHLGPNWRIRNTTHFRSLLFVSAATTTTTTTTKKHTLFSSTVHGNGCILSEPDIDCPGEIFMTDVAGLYS
jgi:hypothetical protein